MAATKSAGNYTAYFNSLETTLDSYLVGKAPALPANAKQLLVKILPWFALISFIVTLPLVLAFMGISTLVMPFSFVTGLGNGLNAIIGMVILAISLGFEAMAIPGLFKQAAKAWRLIYYSTLLMGLYNIVTLSIGSLIFTVIALYLLFQIKSYYK